MTHLARALRGALRRHAPRRYVTRLGLDNSYRIWMALNNLDAAIAQHRARGATFVTIRLEFEGEETTR